MRHCWPRYHADHEQNQTLVHDLHSRCCRSWEEERATLLAQISALQTAGKTRQSRGSDDWSIEEEMQELKDELNVAREKEVCWGGLAERKMC